MLDGKEKVIGAVIILFLFALYAQWSRLETYEESKMDLKSMVSYSIQNVSTSFVLQIGSLERKKGDLEQWIFNAERDIHRYKIQLSELDAR